MKRFLSIVLTVAILCSGFIVSSQTIVEEIMVDNQDPGFSKNGTWDVVTSDVAVNNDYLVSSGNSQDWAMWKPDIKVPGYYHIFIKTYQFTGKAYGIRVEVGHKGGISEGHRISLYIDSGYWHPLDTYYFEPGDTAYVKIYGGSGKLFADSVKFVYSEQQDAKPDKSNKQSLERMLSLNLAFKLDRGKFFANGIEKILDVNPALVNNRTYIPLRAAGESLGAQVFWNEDSEKATLVKDDKTIEITIGENRLFINGQEREFDGASFVENERTMVPLRAISEAFDKEVFYQDDGLILISDIQNKVDLKRDINIINDFSKLFDDFIQVPPSTYLVECESFKNLGGWVLDQQSMDLMGSPYIMAHGLGKPVINASTFFDVKDSGEYYVWARTKNWVEEFGNSGAPGKFNLKVNDVLTNETFGTEGADWHWQNGGKVNLKQGSNNLDLIDLTGFNGRCDAILFTKDEGYIPPNESIQLSRLRDKLNPSPIEDKGSYDLVVVGGGVAGVCASVGAARMGVKVALIQDRPVLGGNSSTEVRVNISGKSNYLPYPHIGDLVNEYQDAKDKFSFVNAEKNLTLLINYHADGVDVANDKSIKSVYATDTVTGKKIKVSGNLFADCTGDGTLGYIAGADYELKETGIMGSTNMWWVKNTNKPVDFPSIDWGFNLDGINYPGKKATSDAQAAGMLGGWTWESGYDTNYAIDIEHVRDTNLLGMFSTWNYLKNVDKKMINYDIGFSAYIAGKRESRRLIGDEILQVNDVYDGTIFLDGLVPCTWSVDLHYPDPTYDQQDLKHPFLAYCVQIGYSEPFWLPYRTLYSRNIPNLFMAGRDISVTHEALGATRVMKTTGMMGEIVGLASKICVDKKALPRDVYDLYLDDLKDYALTAWKK